jgi:ABC-type cobalt transport system substrate-binding protein
VYKMAKKTANRVVSEARSQIYDRLFQLWGTKEGSVMSLDFQIHNCIIIIVVNLGPSQSSQV